MTSDTQPRPAPDGGGDTAGVVPADPTRLDALARLMAAAFQLDPLSAWIFPDADARPVQQRAFFTPFLENAFADGEVWTTPEEAGLALWFPVDPARPEGPAVAEALERGLAPVLEGAVAERFAALAATMDAGHPGEESHHYLAFLAVVPEHQGAGVGSRLLRVRSAELDAAGTPAYLEASSPRNAALYRRLGFRSTGAPLRLPDPQGPPLFPMWRSVGGG